ncbi:MAG: SBBP repeat-containing protein [Saprospiraceae bacterium]
MVRNDISYYNINNSVNLALSVKGRVSYTWNVEDLQEEELKSFRIDMFRNNNETGVQPVALGKSKNYLNFFYPHCPNGVTDVRGFERIIYPDYYNEIDYHLTSNQAGIKHMYVVKPGGNPNDIELRFKGQDSLVNTINNLEMYLDGETILLPNAIAYEVTSSGQIIPSNWSPNFTLINSDVIQFNVGNYNTNNTLVLVQSSPVIPTAPPVNNNAWSTYIGGNNSDVTNGVDSDANENIVVVGTTRSINLNSFQPSPGSGVFQSTLAGLQDAYVVKFDNTDNELWATYIGGTDDDNGEKIVIDNNNDIFIIGDTKSTNLPTKCPTGATCNNYSGQQDVFIVKLKSDGSDTEWLTYYGGSLNENAVDIDINPSDDVYYSIQYLQYQLPNQK